jgi:hypothetical protein
MPEHVRSDAPKPRPLAAEAERRFDGRLREGLAIRAAEHQLGFQVPMRPERGLEPRREWNLAFPPTLRRVDDARQEERRTVSVPVTKPTSPHARAMISPCRSPASAPRSTSAQRSGSIFTAAVSRNSSSKVSAPDARTNC